MEDFDIVLLPDFDIPRDEVQQLVVAALAAGEDVAIEFRIIGQPGLTDTQQRAEQFLYAAYVGEAIAPICTKFECICPASTRAHLSVEFYVVPNDPETLVAKLWESIPGLMAEELREQAGYGDEWAMQCWGEAWDLLDAPQQVTYTSVLIEHAMQILREADYRD